MKFKIDPEVIAKFPRLIANVTLIKGFNNQPSAEVSAKILQLLRTNEAALRFRFPSKNELMVDPNLVMYFDFFRLFGVNPKKVSPSHAALSDRVVRGGNLPDINPAVNLYNAFSIAQLVPFGGEDLDKVGEYFELAIAKGSERWVGIGETEAIAPKVGDLIWRDKNDVSTLSLNWRQCEKTKLTETTTNGYFISEGFDDFNQDRIEAVAQEFITTFTSLLGGSGEQHLLSQNTPEVDV